MPKTPVLTAGKELVYVKLTVNIRGKRQTSFS